MKFALYIIEQRITNQFPKGQSYIPMINIALTPGEIFTDISRGLLPNRGKNEYVHLYPAACPQSA